MNFKLDLYYKNLFVKVKLQGRQYKKARTCRCGNSRVCVCMHDKGNWVS